MISSPQSPKVDDPAQTANTFSVSLPVELVLDILNHAILRHRKDELYRSLSLSLVCRTVRNMVLPIVYEVLFIDVFSVRAGTFMGWDGKEYKHKELAFLTWLLYNPSAPPRQHIRHLIFRHDGDFTGELTWSGPRAEDTPAEWPLERVTVRYLSDMECLYNAGMRPRQAFHNGSPSETSDEMPCDLFSKIVLNILATTEFLMHSQVWASRPEEVIKEDGRACIRVRHQLVTRTKIEPRTCDFVLSEAQPNSGIMLTVQLVEGDYFQQYPSLLLAGIAAFLKGTPIAPIVLMCGVGYRISGLSVAEFIRAAISTTLPEDDVQGRVRISYRGCTPLMDTDNLFDALAHELRCGGDPWDGGHELNIGPEHY